MRVISFYCAQLCVKIITNAQLRAITRMIKSYAQLRANLARYSFPGMDCFFFLVNQF